MAGAEPRRAQPRLELAHDGRRPDRRRVVEHEQRAQRRDGLAEAVEGTPLELAIERAHARVRLGGERVAELDAEGGAAEPGETAGSSSCERLDADSRALQRLAHGARHAERVRVVAVQAQRVGCAPRALRRRSSARRDRGRCVPPSPPRLAGRSRPPRAASGRRAPGAVVGAVDEGLGRDSAGRRQGRRPASPASRRGRRARARGSRARRRARSPRRARDRRPPGCRARRAASRGAASRRGPRRTRAARPPGRARRPRPRRAPP